MGKGKKKEMELRMDDSSDEVHSLLPGCVEVSALTWKAPAGATNGGSMEQVVRTSLYIVAVVAAYRPLYLADPPFFRSP